jgi:hypothetical protein
MTLPPTFPVMLDMVMLRDPPWFRIPPACSHFPKSGASFRNPEHHKGQNKQVGTAVVYTYIESRIAGEAAVFDSHGPKVVDCPTLAALHGGS